MGNHCLEYVLEELKHIRSEMSEWQKAEDIFEEIQIISDQFEDINYKISCIQESFNSLENFQSFMEKVALVQQEMEDQKNKLIENTQRVNEMALELKGVIAQARSCVNERKDFVKNLGAALQELT